jgi:predicted short-subunit dehydrogenase-like oxidoreductase (DUF2520 family)
VFTPSALPAADLVLLGVGDAAIPAVAAALAERIRTGLVVHFAGSLGVAPLGSLIAAGADAAALHPVQACPDFETAVERLPGSAWGVTCAEKLRVPVHGLIARDLRGLPVDVLEEHRPLWHAAAVISSNGIAALLAFGERTLESIGIEEPERVLGPLAAGAVSNARARGGGAATLTGPIVRRDSETIARHLRAFEAGPGHLAATYLGVTRLILDEAEASGRIDARAASEMRGVLGTA